MSVTQAIETETFEDAEALAQNVAEWLSALAQASEDERVMARKYLEDWLKSRRE